MPPNQTYPAVVTLTEVDGTLTLALSTPYRTCPELQCSVPSIPNALASTLAGEISLGLSKEACSVWADEDVEKKFWNYYHMGRGTSSSEFMKHMQNFGRAIASSRPCGQGPQAVDAACFSGHVLADIGSLNDALKSNSSKNIARLGASCKAYQEHAAWMLRHLQAWLRRQFVLYKLGLPHELNDVSGRAATQLSQWISSLNKVVKDYEAWRLKRGGSTNQIKWLPVSSPRKGKALRPQAYQQNNMQDEILVSDWATVRKAPMRGSKKAFAIKSPNCGRKGCDCIIHRRHISEQYLRKKLDHPNILPIIRDFRFPDRSSDPLCTLVSPWCIPARDYIVAHGERVPQLVPVISVLLNLLEQLLRGLKYVHAHTQGCQYAQGCHGNLKGSNVMVMPDGTLKICDFVLRFPRGKPLQLGKYSKQERASVAYMSPELIMTMVPTWQSDMWAASCVFVEMATGHTPYDDRQSVEEVVEDIKAGRPPVVQPDTISTALWQLVSENFRRKPDNRPKASVMLTRLWILRYQSKNVGELPAK